MYFLFANTTQKVNFCIRLNGTSPYITSASRLFPAVCFLSFPSIGRINGVEKKANRQENQHYSGLVKGNQQIYIQRTLQLLLKKKFQQLIKLVQSDLSIGLVSGVCSLFHCLNLEMWEHAHRCVIYLSKLTSSPSSSLSQRNSAALSTLYISSLWPLSRFLAPLSSHLAVSCSSYKDCLLANKI